MVGWEGAVLRRGAEIKNCRPQPPLRTDSHGVVRHAFDWKHDESHHTASSQPHTVGHKATDGGAFGRWSLRFSWSDSCQIIQLLK